MRSAVVPDDAVGWSEVLLNREVGRRLGLTHERVSSERRLTEALAWVRGGPPQRRFDCLGV